jgi:hypothetical protein
VGSYGIYASTVKSCSARDCGNGAIAGDQVYDCRGQCPGNGFGISAYIIVQNCYGTSDGSGYGIAANELATGCLGSSVSGTGLSAFVANGCIGATSTGTGLSTTHNVNSY